MITIEPLTSLSDTTVGDLDALVKELRVDAGQDTPAGRADVEDLIADPNAVCMTARDGERIVGMGSLYVLPKIGKRTAFVEDVVVLAEYRGQKLGERIVQALIDEARVRRVRSISLTSRPSRVAAHHLYEKLGFKKRETDPFRLEL